MKFQKYLIFNIWVCVTDSPWCYIHQNGTQRHQLIYVKTFITTLWVIKAY